MSFLFIIVDPGKPAIDDHTNDLLDMIMGDDFTPSVLQNLDPLSALPKTPKLFPESEPPSECS